MSRDKAPLPDRPICIAEDLCLPLEATTQTFAILAKRGAGKTYTASVLVEELLGVGSQVVVLDPLDSWWGLRAGADGETAGLPILVLGGQHGDLPLDATNGTVVADLVVSEGVSVVFSLRHLSKTAQCRFVAEFCERLYHRKGEDWNRLPLHVVIDEADAFVPQRVAGDTARVMGAVDDLVRRGRSSGIGVTLITQRASVIHKDVLTQLEVLVVLRTVSPQDRKAIESWIEAHDPEDRGREVLASLASLPVGTAWVWSPGWLELLQRVRIRRRWTFDSSSTPTVGQQIVEPRQLAPVDLERIQEQLAATIEQAEANDPKALRKRIAELERKLRERPQAPPEVQVEYRDHPGTLRAVRYLWQRLGGLADTLIAAQEELTRIQALAARVGNNDELGPFEIDNPTVPLPATGPPAPRPERPPAVSRPKPAADGPVTLRKGARKMLATLAGMDRPLTRQQLATLSGFTVSGGTFGTYLGDLKRSGCIDEVNGLVTVTSAGIAALEGDVPVASSTRELLELWRSRLRAGERRMLDVLVDRYPAAMSRDDLGEVTGFTTSGGTFGTYLGVLRRNGLVDVDGSEVRASETLFIA